MSPWHKSYFYWIYLLCWLPHSFEMPWLSSASVLTIVGWSWLADRRKIPFLNFIPRLLIIITSVVLIWQQHKTLLGPDAATPLLLVLSALKFHELKEQRDALVFLFICLLLIMFALLFKQNLFMTFYMVMMTIIVAIAGIAMHTPPKYLKQVLKSSPRLVAFDLVLCLPIFLLFFFFFPRFQTPWGQMGATPDANIGFSGEFNPGDIASLAQSDEIAFRVQFEEGLHPPSSLLYWRAVVMVVENGWQWTPRFQPSTPAVPESKPHATYRTLWNYRITLEPRFDRFLFSLDRPVQLATTNANLQNSIIQKNDLVYQSRYSVMQKIQYVGQSQIGSYDKQADLSPPHEDYTKITSPVSQEMKNLIKPWRWLSSEEKIDAVLDHFKTQSFSYSLNVTTMNTIDEFLFQHKTGYCGHYAGSFAYLMRLLGVPSRIVTGFHGGEWNEFSDEWVVRDKNAHSWTEVWLKKKGWVRIDPTQAVSGGRNQIGDLLGQGITNQNLLMASFYKANQFLDAINSRYSNFLLNYNNDAQEQILEWLPKKLSKWQRILGICILTFVFLLLVNFTLKARQTVAQNKIDLLYAPLFTSLQKSGLERVKTEGPLQYAERIHKTNPTIAAEVDSLIKSYTVAKYGPEHTLSDSDLPELRREIKRARRALQQNTAR